MPGRPFRFVHSSDFHLETPLAGVAEVPDHLRKLFVEAPYVAARAVFDATLTEGADFLVLAGDILQPLRTGPRGPLFLVEQFARLAERGIQVYWAGGEVDAPDGWPAAFRLPENAHVFPSGRVAEFVCQRGGLPLARMVGTSRGGDRPIQPGDFIPDAGGLFSIAVAHGEAEVAELGSRGFGYWAIGGQHDRTLPDKSATGVASHSGYYSGSPQGRCPDEPGPHGCSLVHVDESGQARTSFIPTEAARWLTERITVDKGLDRTGLEGLLRARMRMLLESAPKCELLVSWTVSGSGPLLGQLRRGALAGDVLAWLRTEYGSGQPAAWSVTLEVEPAGVLPEEWYEQETIRGDFLRAVRELESSAAEPLRIESYLSESQLAGSLGAAATPGAAARQQVLREAALLGADLLSGE